MSIIVKHPDGRYFLWSTICDAPVSYCMTREELIEHTRQEEGRRGVEESMDRLERADAKGTSSMVDKDADEVMWLNRAGRKERPLTRAQILAYVAKPGSHAPDGFHEPPDLPDDDPRGWTFGRYMGRT